VTHYACDEGMVFDTGGDMWECSVLRSEQPIGLKLKFKISRFQTRVEGAFLWKNGELSFGGDVDLLAREYFGCSVSTFSINSCGA
jgi:hypothetical protein